MDYVEIKDLIVFAQHGVFQEEKELGQKFLVSARLYMDMEQAVRTDDLLSSVHYGEVALLMTKFLQAKSYNLIETCAGRLAEHLLLNYPLLRKVKLRLAKPWAPVGLPLDEVAVCLERAWQPAVIAVGSNIGEREEYIEDALAGLDENPLIRRIRTSSLIETEPYGYMEQNKFLNGAVYIETLLSAGSLLHYLQELEQKAGRERKIHWGPRTLDLDLIYYADLILDSEELSVPHPEMQKRRFVLEPIVEIAPNYVDPRYGRPVSDLLTRLDKES